MMSEYVDSPFQMDEDLVPDEECVAQKIPSLLDKGQTSLLINITPDEAQFAQPVIVADERNIGGTSTTFPEPEGPLKLRSRIGLLKSEEATGTTTEEDELTYEEDVDDKFDKDAAARLHAEFKAAQAAQQKQPLTPPENFAPVIDKIYRSSFPQAQNFPFLKKLGLKSVLCLIPEEYPQSHEEFFEQEGIKLFQLGMAGNKEPFVKISLSLITEAMKILLDPENRPILIHCNRGKHRTGCLVGTLRRLQGWSLTIIFDEYRKFAAPKERSMDQQFIELYDQTDILRYAQTHNYLPLPWD
ncbi:hypothetical protein PUMCH_003637 [Australozyma saopauloensis]|uniref:diphosphoinositol-polyphosphate diphosphatase n=1 Tax=Australozyma saopauloensis TaxID=291208 RepID=A0AAX4HCG7_9ASCO|nr:hypothetical protein PUMCH_003637 [[Candida] saopauloensis]